MWRTGCGVLHDRLHGAAALGRGVADGHLLDADVRIRDIDVRIRGFGQEAGRFTRLVPDGHAHGGEPGRFPAVFAGRAAMAVPATAPQPGLAPGDTGDASQPLLGEAGCVDRETSAGMRRPGCAPGTPP
ncbi:hypothetical protein BU197_25415 [Streptomyces sp. CBMA291]|nr:hypothetical protein [Streptomyces sp. CBMA291]MBD0716583.1 hypothetical protein [Streptomyces sp. CBMA370]